MPNVNAPLLIPSTLVDSSCDSAIVGHYEYYGRPIPTSFDSDDYRDFVGYEFDRSQTPYSDPPTVAAVQPVLPPFSGCKPSMPIMPPPINITAHTRPSHYGTYINSVLAPLTTDTARSSYTTTVDTETPAFSDKENGHQFTNYIANEVKHRRKDASPAWILMDVVFPPKAFPQDFRNTFRHSRVWNKDTETYTRMPASLVEEDMVLWLNWIVQTLGSEPKLFNENGESLNPDGSRVWDKRTVNSGPTGSTHYSEPSISLLNCATRSVLKPDAMLAWQNIQSFAEVTQSERTLDDVVHNITEKAYLMFESQPYRRYVVALGFFGPMDDPKWVLVLIDRSGVVSSSQFGFIGSSGINLGLVLYALSFAKADYIGIDETMTVSRFTGAVTHITVTGQTPTSAPGRFVKRIFEVVQLLHSTSQVSGRATRVCIVRRKGRYYILKDYWPFESKHLSEIRHLLAINKTIQNDANMCNALKHTYPVFIVGQELGDSTLARRSLILDKPIPRVHTRIVTKAVGDPLTSFRSKYELCSVLCDVVNYLKYSAETCRVCHGDISLKNIVINRVWDDDDDDKDKDDDNSDDDISSDSLNTAIDESCTSKIPSPGKVYPTDYSTNSELASPVDLPTELGSISTKITSQPSSTIKAYGLVIDNDNSFSLDDFAEPGCHVNMGTLPFLALDALKCNVASDFIHEPKHDLESLFYVLIALCTYTTGPSCLRSSVPVDNELSVCLNEWWTTHDRHRLARIKGGILLPFNEYILQRLPPYWTDFHHVLTGLYSALWPEDFSALTHPNVATHDAFLDILIKAQDTFHAAEEPYPFAPIPEAQAEKHTRQSGSRKRKNSNEDDEGANRGRKCVVRPFSTYVDSGAPRMV